MLTTSLACGGKVIGADETGADETGADAGRAETGGGSGASSPQGGGNGVGGSGGIDGVGGTGGATIDFACKTGEHECDLCLADFCQPQCASYLEHPEKDAYAECLVLCVDEECRAACDSEFPGVAGTIDAFYECTEGDKCMIPCHGPPNDKCWYLPESQVCGECIEANCKSECIAWSTSDPELGDYMNCKNACWGDEACQLDCAAAYPDGATKVNGFNGCIKSKCPMCEHEGNPKGS